MPLFSRKAFWSPTDVPQLQNTVQLNNPALSAAQLSLAAAQHHAKKTRNLSTKSSKREALTRTHTHAYLGCRRRAPRGGRRVSASFCRQDWGCRTMFFGCGRKWTWAATQELGSAHPPWRSSAGDCSASAPFCDAFLDARSRSKRVHLGLRCGPRWSFWIIHQKEWWKHNYERNDAMTLMQMTLDGPSCPQCSRSFSSVLGNFFHIYTILTRPCVWVVCKARWLPNIVKMQQNQPMFHRICLGNNAETNLMCR